MPIKKCGYCGEEFLATREFRKYCCQECAEKGAKKKEKERYTIKPIRQKPSAYTPAEQELKRYVMRANRLGISYGKYVALKEAGLVD